MQRAVLGYLLTNETFFLLAQNHVEPGWFTEEKLNGKIYAILEKYYETYRLFPSIEAIRAHDDVMCENVAVQNQIQNQINACIAQISNFDLIDIQKRMTSWLQAMTFKDGIEKSSAAFNGLDFEKVQGIWRETDRLIREVQFDDLGIITFKNYGSDFEEELNNRTEALTTGIHVFDQALLDGAVAGGLQKGDMTLLLAPVNVGKTTTMITIAIHNVKIGKSVLFITHEGRFKDIRTKMWMSMFGKTKFEIYAMYKDPQTNKRLAQMAVWLDQHLVYIPINKPGMTVEYVESTIRRVQEDRIAKTGKGFDLLVSDYPAKLTTVRAAKGNLPRREIDRIVYDYYVQMGLEHNFHVLAAIQTNREGSRVNKGQREDRLLNMEDVSESWGPMEMATNVISINRSPEAIKEKRVTFFICKSRSSETGKAIACKSRYDCAVTHSEDLGATWYRGDSPMDEVIETLIAQYHGIAVPETAIFST
jgi:KaiC/GvpD/RAD55 family RecA-like ATPase